MQTRLAMHMNCFFIFLCFSTRPTWIGEREATFVACAFENVLKSARDQSGEPKTLRNSDFDCLRSSKLDECGFRHVWLMINAGFDIAFCAIWSAFTSRFSLVCCRSEVENEMKCNLRFANAICCGTNEKIVKKMKS